MEETVIEDFVLAGICRNFQEWSDLVLIRVVSGTKSTQLVFHVRTGINTGIPTDATDRNKVTFCFGAEADDEKCQSLRRQACRLSACSPQVTEATTRNGGASYTLTRLRCLPQV